jgi:drug/metabolite transporter (DMT)-like permease
MRTVSYTTLALIAFAANSVLCRSALHNGAIDPASFSSIRFASAAATLLLISAPLAVKFSAAGSWTSAAILFLYAVPFSFAYARLNTGAGALILFGSVQLTMMSAALWSGERPHTLQWSGLGLAIGGLAYLMLPGLTAPPAGGAGLMALAGVGWGLYSLRGRASENPLAQTVSNFVRLMPLLLMVSLVAGEQLHIDFRGARDAVLSGALGTGLGYVVWYLALRGLTATRAAVVQLAVPIGAAAGGVVFLGELISQRLIVATVLVLGGIALALFGHERRADHAG